MSLDNFIEVSDINYWMFGHTHYNGGTDIKLRTATLLTNQLGYVKYREHKGFCNDCYIFVRKDEF